MSSLTVVPLETPTLGDRSYLVHDGEVAFVVDPQRDIDRVLALLDEHGVRLTHVFETHLHNDYVTGGLALAQRTGAQYLLNGEDDVSFDRTPLADGQVVEVGGRMRVTALATPGHTFTHLSYALTETRGGTGGELDRSVGVFSGGSLLYGATGRPDLLGPEHTHDLVRGRPRAGHAQLRAGRRLSDVPRLAGRVGHPDHPPRRDRRRRRRGAARAGPDRHRPSRRPRDRQARGLERPRAELVRHGDLRRPGPGAAPPRGGRPRRTPCRRARRRPHQWCGQRPPPRAGGPPCRRARGRGLGPLRRRVPRVGRRLHARRRRASAARGAVFGAVALGGAVAGARASAHVAESVLLACFAALMLLVAGVMVARLLSRENGGAPRRAALDDPIITFSPTFACQCPRALKVLVTATVVGLLTGLLGVGGGFLVVPALLLALALPMEYAAGTSLVVITMTSAVALAVRAGAGVAPDWWLVVVLTAAFTVLVLAVAVYTAVRAFPALF